MNELEIVRSYTNHLRERGVSFTSSGFPIFKKEWLIENKPKAIMPFDRRNEIVSNEKETSICFFEDDMRLYPRFDKVFEEISILKKYHSVCMMDVSISPLMDIRLQNMNLLLNMLYICVLAVNDIKIIPFFRSGDISTVHILKESFKDSPYWVMGALGTQRNKNSNFYDRLFRCKCLELNPKCLLIYGTPSKETLDAINDYEILYEVYEDFRTLSFTRGLQNGRL